MLGTPQSQGAQLDPPDIDEEARSRTRRWRPRRRSRTGSPCPARHRGSHDRGRPPDPRPDATPAPPGHTRQAAPVPGRGQLATVCHDAPVTLATAPIPPSPPGATAPSVSRRAFSIQLRQQLQLRPDKAEKLNVRAHTTILPRDTPETRLISKCRPTAVSVTGTTVTCAPVLLTCRPSAAGKRHSGSVSVGFSSHDATGSISRECTALPAGDVLKMSERHGVNRDSWIGVICLST